MRYDTPIYFQQILPGEYDPETGNYQEDRVTEEQRMAAVMDTNTETMQLVYGKIRQGSLTIHLQNRYIKPYDRIRIGSRLYTVSLKRDLRVKQTMILTEVQNAQN